MNNFKVHASKLIDGKSTVKLFFDVDMDEFDELDFSGNMSPFYVQTYDISNI